LGVHNNSSAKRGKRPREDDVLGTNKSARIGGRVASLGSDVRMGWKDPAKKGDRTFKVPDVPFRFEQPVADGEEDVFGTVGPNVRNKGSGKGKGKEETNDVHTDLGGVEKDNKVVCWLFW
jgi:hypothetical protein